MQQKHQNLLPTIFNSQFLTNRELRRNPERELRNDLNYATSAHRLNMFNRFPAPYLPNLWNNFYQDELNNETSIIRDCQQFKKSLEKFLMSRLNENYVCNRLFCPSCLN